MPLERVTGYIHDKNISGFRALFGKAGLPSASYPAFREAITALREGILVGEQGGCRDSSGAWSNACWRPVKPSAAEEMTSLLSLLRRFAVEAAREEARMFCDDLVANDQTMPSVRQIDDARMVA